MSSRSRIVADAVATALWGAGMALAGWFRRPVARWKSPGNLRVLVVAPHPDDELAGCGGTIALHREAGDQVTVLHVTDGRRSRALPVPPDVMGAHRRAEARESLHALGVESWEWFGLPEAEWSHQGLVTRCAVIITARRPHLVYLPSRVDFHPEHEAVARAVAAALAGGHGPRVRVYQVQVPLTNVLTNVVAPVERVWNRVDAAFRAYGSQEATLRSCRRLRRYAALAHHIPGRAEEFWEMTARSYLALHANRPGPPAFTTFRGLRRLALTDPLAFLVGRRERRRLKALAAAAR